MLYPVVVNEFAESSTALGKKVVVFTRKVLWDTSQCSVAFAVIRGAAYFMGMEIK